MPASRTCPITGEALTPEWYVSRKAIRTLRELLARGGDIVEDLHDAVARMYRFTDRNGPRSSERPLPYDPDKSRHYDRLTSALSRWAIWVAQVRGVSLGPSGGWRTWSGLCGFLSEHAEWLARHPDGERAYPELVDLLRKARSVVDRPPDRVYAGKCGAPVVYPVDGAAHPVPAACDAELYGLPGEPNVTCRRCGHVWPVSERREEMLARVADMLLPAEDLARAISALSGTLLSATTVRQWKSRGLIHSDTYNEKGQPLYRVAEVLDRMRESGRQEANR